MAGRDLSRYRIMASYVLTLVEILDIGTEKLLFHQSCPTSPVSILKRMPFEFRGSEPPEDRQWHQGDISVF